MPPRSQTAQEAIKCAGAFAEAVGSAWSTHVSPLLPRMFDPGLTSTLVQSLSRIMKNIPALTPAIQAEMKNAISALLAGVPFRDAVGTPGKPSPVPWRPSESTAHLMLAITTLGSFNLASENIFRSALSAYAPWRLLPRISSRAGHVMCTRGAAEGAVHSMTWLIAAAEP